MQNCLKLDIPNSCSCITPGCKIKLGRFQTTTWIVSYGWYSWGGNRPVCGWYLVNEDDSSKLKPLQLPDLDDIYVIQA